MPEEDPEKLAAARKKFEQLKKANKTKKAPLKKDEKKDADAVKDAEDGDKKKKEEEPPKSPTKSKDQTASHTRKASVSQESRMRSTSFRASMGSQAVSPPLKSPTSSANPTAEAADVYRKQAARIEELEALVKKLEANITKLHTVEDELDTLREAQVDLPHLKERANQAAKFEDEISALKRQNAQLQAAAKRQDNTASPEADLKADLDSKTATIESLELEMSNLNARLASVSSTSDDHVAKISHLETQLDKTESARSSAIQELADLRKSLEESAASSTDEADVATLKTKIATAEAELGSAKRAATEASIRSDTLEKKIAALSSVHREQEARSAVKLADAGKHEREAKELRSRIAGLRTDNDRLRSDASRRKRLDADAGDESGLDELEDEEREKLVRRVRELEAANFDLRRGVWREQRKSLQPGLEGEHQQQQLQEQAGGEGSGFDDVDLMSPDGSGQYRVYGQAAASVAAAALAYRQQQQRSSVMDVINSGISAFRGEPAQRGRKASMGKLLEDEDFEFDEDAFKQAQAEEDLARLERVKEVKRGLKKWEGWRVDIADLRAGMGEVFDV